jgi:hypothetical protein
MTTPTAPGRLELIAGKLSAKLIVFAATRAAKRGDVHELNHLVAAVAAGNTGRKGCPPTCSFRHLGHREIKAAIKNLASGS